MVVMGTLSPLLPPLFCDRADLKEGVTDEGLRSLASAGCGGNLKSLALQGSFSCQFASVEGRGVVGPWLGSDWHPFSSPRRYLQKKAQE